MKNSFITALAGVAVIFLVVGLAFGSITFPATRTTIQYSTLTETPNTTVTITEEVISENIATLSTRPNGCVAVFAEIANSTSYILPNSSASQFYATVTRVYTTYTKTVSLSSTSATTTLSTASVNSSTSVGNTTGTITCI